MRRRAIAFALLLASACRCADEPGLLDPALDGTVADAGIAPDADVEQDAGVAEDAEVSLDANVCVVECVHAWEPLDDFALLFGVWNWGGFAYVESTRQLIGINAYDNRVLAFDHDANVWRELETHGELPPPSMLYLYTYATHDEVVAFGARDGIWVLNIASRMWRQVDAGAVPWLDDRFSAFDRAGERLFAVTVNELYMIDLDGLARWTRFDIAGGPLGLDFVYFDRGRDVLIAGSGREMWSLTLDDPAWTLLDDTWPFDQRRFFTSELPDAPPMIYGAIAGVWTLARSSTSGPITWTTDPAPEPFPALGWYVYAEDRSELFHVGDSTYPQTHSTTLRSFRLGAPLEWIDTMVGIALPIETGIDPAAAYDPLRDELYVVHVNTLDDTTAGWVRPAIRGASWSRLPDGLRPYSLVDVVWDEAGDRLMLVGTRFDERRVETWTFNPEPAPAWSEVVTSTRPAISGRPLLAYDTRSGRTLLFDDARREVHELELDSTPTWTRIAHEGDAPSARNNAAAIYDLPGDRLIVFGGYVPNTMYEWLFDTYALDFNFDPPRWTRLDDQLEHSLEFPEAVYLPQTREMMVHGRRANEAWECDRLEELWFFDLGAPSGAQWRRDGSGGVRSRISYSHALVETPGDPLLVGPTTWQFDRAENCGD